MRTSFILALACLSNQGTLSTLDTGTQGTEDTSVSDSGEGETGGDSGDTGMPLEVAPDYALPGPWTAGHLTDNTLNREGSPLILRVWFPAGKEGAEPRVYGWDDFNFEGESFTDVQPACDEPRPVMVHSHGDQSVGWEMFFLHEFAATHGWLVLAMDHPGNTLYGSSQDYGELFSQRPADVMDAYDWLVTESADPGSPLSGCVDESDGYVATGYSFGGYTAYATSGALVNGIEGRETLDHSDDRVTAVVTFAPWNASGSLSTGTSAITVPVLTLGADRDERVGTQYQDLFSSVTAIPRVLGGFVNAGHLSFAAIYCFVPGDGCGPDYHAIEDFETRVRTATLAFLGHARGQTGAIEQLPAADEELVWEMVLE